MFNRKQKYLKESKNIWRKAKTFKRNQKCLKESKGKPKFFLEET